MAQVQDYAPLAESTLHSVFCVEATLKHQVYPTQLQPKLKYYERTALVDPSLLSTSDDENDATKAAKTRKKRGKQPAAQEPVEEPKKGSKRDDGTRNSTGFVIASSGRTLKILTCAHIVDECYASDVTDLTVNEINMFFLFEVTCSHQEMDIHSKLDTKEISEQLRVKSRAICVALDTKKDLMVLQVSADKIYIGYNSADVNIMCPEQHPAIAMFSEIPTKLEPCMLQGWPPQCIESYNIGHLSFSNRSYPAITQLNPKGYTMKLADFNGMVALSGCSGGPIVALNKKCLGVYHGVIEDVRGYAVNASDVMEFLERFNVLTQWPAADEGNKDGEDDSDNNDEDDNNSNNNEDEDANDEVQVQPDDLQVGAGHVDVAAPGQLSAAGPVGGVAAAGPVGGVAAAGPVGGVAAPGQLSAAGPVGGDALAGQVGAARRVPAPGEVFTYQRKRKRRQNENE